MNAFLISSGIGNVVLIITSALLFSSNTDLTSTVGEQKSSISTLNKDVTGLRTEVQVCTNTVKTKILQCNQRIDVIKTAADKRLREVQGELRVLTEERVELTAELRNIKMPAKKQKAADRLKAIDDAINETLEAVK